MASFRLELPRELLWAGLRQDPWRFALALLAISLGVALGYAIVLINAQASDEFGRAARELSGDAQLVVNGPRDGFDEQVYARLAALDDLAGVSPALELDVKRSGEEGSVRLMALDVFRAVRVQPGLVPVPADEGDILSVLRPNHVFVNAAAQARWRLRVGDDLAVQSGLAVATLRVAGTLAAGTESPLLVMDIAAAQKLFERQGLVNRIDLRMSPGADAVQVRERIAAMLPAGVTVVTVEQSDVSARRMTRAYRVNLAVLALVALFTGALMVHATQSLSVQRRATQHAIWRALGVTRGQLRGALLSEAALTGVAGGLLGVLFGAALAGGALRWMQSDLNAVMVPGVALPPFDALTAIAMVGCGALAALSGALLAALRAARLPVADALRSRDTWHWESVRSGNGLGWGLLLIGAGLCLAPPLDELPVFGYLAIVALLLGTLVLLPGLARLLLSALPATSPLSLSLPAAQLRGAISQVSLSLAATVAAVSLSVAMAIMVASFRDSLDHWLERVLPAELYLRAGQPNDTAYMDETTQARIRTMAGVERVQYQRTQQVLLTSERPRVTLLARDLEGISPEEVLPLIGTALAPAQRGQQALWVSEIAAALHGLSVGERLDLPIAGRKVPFVVAGIWRDYARQQGAVLMERARYVELTGDRRVNEAALWLAKGADAQAVTRALGVLGKAHDLDVLSAQHLRTVSMQVFDRTFAITYALEAVAIFIGLVGLSSSVGALVLSRRREFGVLRHLGVTSGGIRRLLAVEGMMTTGTGIAVGAVLGAAMSWILIHVINRQSFHWSMDMDVPWLALSVFALSLLLLATLTSWWSARQAVGVDLVRAVKQDW